MQVRDKEKKRRKEKKAHTGRYYCRLQSLSSKTEKKAMREELCKALEKAVKVLEAALLASVGLVRLKQPGILRSPAVPPPLHLF